MRLYLLGFFALSFFFSCKSDTAAVVAAEKEPEQETIDNDFFKDTNEVYAKLDRLKIRSDSSLSSKTLHVMAVGDTMLFLDIFSHRRDNLQLRGKYYHEPWLYVQHQKTKKKGWVYAGACTYDSKNIKSKIDNTSPLLKEVYADDIEWEGTVPTGWSVATIQDAADFKKFLIRFKEYVASGNSEAISKLINYPIRNVPSKNYFIDNYDRIFSDKLKKIVADQRLDRIFRNSQGASLGNGDIYFQQIKNDYKIISINFKGRDDIKRELMRQLSKTYTAKTVSGLTYSIKSFKIKDFLELSLNYEEANGYPRTKSLGRYIYETSHNGRHGFVQDSKDSSRLKLIFEAPDSSKVVLKILGDSNPSLTGLSFIGL